MFLLALEHLMMRERRLKDAVLEVPHMGLMPCEELTEGSLTDLPKSAMGGIRPPSMYQIFN